MDPVSIGHVLFLDIETAPLVYKYSEMQESYKKLWDQKCQYMKDTTPEEHYSKAGVFAEFAKVICICIGYFNGTEFRIKSFSGDDEKDVLTKFKTLLTVNFNDPKYLLCAHNGKEFDFPFLCRRMLVNEISIPKILQIQGKKPWEIQHLDT